LILILDKNLHNIALASDKILAVLSFIIFCVVEEAMFVSMKRDIILLISSVEIRVYCM